ncbi:MAG: histone deacetylase [Chloroflexi bacterium]|nr:histone deacetylase [Chloroflexota bacterium]
MTGEQVPSDQRPTTSDPPTVAFVTNPNHIHHFTTGHPESPERLEATLALLRECGLRERLHELEPRLATAEELTYIHPPAFVEELQRICAEAPAMIDADTYVQPGSYAAALTAAGSTVAATEAVLAGEVDSAFCALRPPGHHAGPANAMGFCLLNNIAIAAQAARRRHGLERVAIIDIDVHHGNGTQDAFYGDGNLLYVSTHLFPFYPGTGPPSETGAGDGEGANVNIALPAGCGDAEYRAAFEQVVEPVVRRFRPQLVLVSCGFDAHFADPIANMALTNAGYGELASRSLALADELCGGKIVFLLEGGYDLIAVPWGVRTVLEVLLGETPTPDPLGTLRIGDPPNISGLLEEMQALHGLG